MVLRPTKRIYPKRKIEPFREKGVKLSREARGPRTAEKNNDIFLVGTPSNHAPSIPTRKILYYYNQLSERPRQAKPYLLFSSYGSNSSIGSSLICLDFHEKYRGIQREIQRSNHNRKIINNPTRTFTPSQNPNLFKIIIFIKREKNLKYIKRHACLH